MLGCHLIYQISNYTYNNRQYSNVSGNQMLGILIVTAISHATKGYLGFFGPTIQRRHWAMTSFHMFGNQLESDNKYKYK